MVRRRKKEERRALGWGRRGKGKDKEEASMGLSAGRALKGDSRKEP